MTQTDIDNMNFALIAGQLSPKVFAINEKAYKTIHTIVTNHFPGERTEAIQMIYADLKNKAKKILQEAGKTEVRVNNRQKSNH